MILILKEGFRLKFLNWSSSASNWDCRQFLENDSCSRSLLKDNTDARAKEKINFIDYTEKKLSMKLALMPGEFIIYEIFLEQGVF